MQKGILDENERDTLFELIGAAGASLIKEGLDISPHALIERLYEIDAGRAMPDALSKERLERVIKMLTDLHGH